MVNLKKLKSMQKAQRKKWREIDARIEYERLRDGLRLERSLSFQK